MALAIQTVQLTVFYNACIIFLLQKIGASVCLVHFSTFFYCLSGGTGRTDEAGEDVVAVAVGRLAYGSAANSAVAWLVSQYRVCQVASTNQTDRGVALSSLHQVVAFLLAYYKPRASQRPCK